MEETMINKEGVFKSYRKEFGTIATTQKAQAIENLLNMIEADLNNWFSNVGIRQMAYMLATVKHETADTYEPITEYGKGKGKKYGIADKATGQVYYGRGYVQLTWKENYEKFANLLNLDLVYSPDLAKESETAYKIMSLGMRQGLFTGKKLSDYIAEDKCDYTNARRIINGTDRAALIAGYAQKFEKCLLAAL